MLEEISYKTEIKTIFVNKWDEKKKLNEMEKLKEILKYFKHLGMKDVI